MSVIAVAPSAPPPPKDEEDESPPAPEELFVAGGALKPQVQAEIDQQLGQLNKVSGLSGG